MMARCNMPWAVALASLFHVAALGDPSVLVLQGRPQAQIVIDAQAPRMTRLAAAQLQFYVERISGTTLPIVHAPDDRQPVRIFVGRSAHTDRMGLSDATLLHGAHRTIVRHNEVVLLGRDRDYTPREPFLANQGPSETYRMTPTFLAAWDKLTGRQWSFPYLNNHRNRNAELGIWNQDEAGSLHAVNALLHELGVRWYMPGELGEVLPSQQTISLEPRDRTVHPDFAFRYPYQLSRRFSQTTAEEVLWQLRMGFNMPVDLIGEDWSGALTHGLKHVSTDRRRDQVIQKHPEWFALYGDRRDPKAHCLSSQGLFEEAVAYARFMFDQYDAAMVSIMPADGYVNICQCEACAGKATPQRGRNGQLSDYVWSFVDRVAREVYKTHPDHKVSCFAYGAYLLPPLEIQTLSPNLVVGICQTRCTFIDQDQERRYVDEIRQGWLSRLSGDGPRLLIWDYYLHAHHGNGLPAYFPRLIAQDLKRLQGLCMGEFIEVARAPEGVGDFGIQHLNVYTNARLWWNADEDIDAMLEEYYTLYFGPAREPMKAFIEFAESHYPRMTDDVQVLGQGLELFAKAQAAVDPTSIYGRRIALIADYMKPLWPLHQQLLLGKGLDRDKNPESWGGFHPTLEVTFDGQPDEGLYRRAYTLGQARTGERPTNGAVTQFAAEWDDQARTLFLYIVCRDPGMARLNIASRRDGDSNLFLGDLVEVHLETQTHAYYQFVINPAGEIVDIDRHDGMHFDWSSGIEARTFRGNGLWSVELRIPIQDQAEQALDPSGNGISGYRPTRQSPWYINVCRQRVRDGESELYTYSPTGKNGFHDRGKLGRFYVGGKRSGVIRAIERRDQEAREREKAQRQDDLP